MKHQIRHLRVDTDKQNINDYPSVSVAIFSDNHYFSIIGRRPPTEFNRKVARQILYGVHPYDQPNVYEPTTNLMTNVMESYDVARMDVDELFLVIQHQLYCYKPQDLFERSVENWLIDLIEEIIDIKETHIELEALEEITPGLRFDRKTYRLTHIDDVELIHRF